METWGSAGEAHMRWASDNVPNNLSAKLCSANETLIPFLSVAAIDFEEFLVMYKRLFVLNKSAASQDISDVIIPSPRTAGAGVSRIPAPLRKVSIIRDHPRAIICWHVHYCMQDWHSPWLSKVILLSYRATQDEFPYYWKHLKKRLAQT